LAADPTLGSEPGFEHGSFDLSDEALLQLPTDASGQGDWLIPFDGLGGINDITGAVLIDAATGVIDQATWLDPTDPITSMTLIELDQMFGDELSGSLPNDNPLVTPEPSTGLLLLPALGFLLARRFGRGRLKNTV
jgi:hypothetical protein